MTGRSVRGQSTTENLPGTIEETAEDVTARGGEGIAVRCDHTVDSDVEALFARVQQEQGRIDLLVNNACTGSQTVVFHYLEFILGLSIDINAIINQIWCSLEINEGVHPHFCPFCDLPKTGSAVLWCAYQS